MIILFLLFALLSLFTLYAQDTIGEGYLQILGIDTITGKGDEAKKLIKSLRKFDSRFVRYALPSSYCVHYPRLAHSKAPRYLQYTIAELSYGPIAQ